MPHRSVALDSIRGVAILLVMLAHCFTARFPTAGYVGVDLFFVLSGFLIGGNLMDRDGQPHYFADFYIRRIFRIVPLYYIVVLASPLALSQPAWHFLTFTQDIWWARANAMGGRWDAVTWSLAVEEQFYLLAPLLIRSVPRRRLPFVLIGLILAAPLFRASTTTVGTVVLMPCRIDSLCAGILAAWVVRHSVPKAGTILAVLAASGLAYFAVFMLGGGRTSVQIWTVGYTLEAVFFATAVVAVTVDRWQGNRILQWLGIRAYGLYLTHTMMLAWTGNVVFGIVASVILADLSWRWLERPLIEFSKTLTQRGNRPAAAAAGGGTP